MLLEHILNREDLHDNQVMVMPVTLIEGGTVAAPKGIPDRDG